MHATTRWNCHSGKLLTPLLYFVNCIYLIASLLVFLKNTKLPVMIIMNFYWHKSHTQNFNPFPRILLLNYCPSCTIGK
jgi:hypothetical protein